MAFLFHQSWFLAVLLALFFVPGWFLLRAAFDRSRFTVFEWTVLTAAASVALLDFSMLSLDSAHVRFTPVILAATMTVECLVFALIALVRKRHRHTLRTTFLPSGLTRHEAWATFLVLLLTVFVKTVYLVPAGVPSATDLGHHMYWAKLMATTGAVPDYVEQDIVPSGDNYQMSDPQPIADFIVGEHLPFAALSILSGQDFVSAFPVITLFLVNLLSVLALFVLAWRLFYSETAAPRAYTWAAILTLLLIGPLYALSSPQAKFVSGGVVGNTFGNLFIPVLLLAYYRALKEHDSLMLTLGFFLIFALAYIHHLSTFVFLFAAAGAVVFFVATNLSDLGRRIRAWSSLLFHPAPLIFVALAVIFFFFVIAPSYANPSAINTAVGTPTKDTRTGLTLLQLGDSLGAGRLGLGLAALLVLVWPRSRKRYATAFLAGWGGILLVMAIRPEWLFVDIPSNRISTYAAFPIAVLAAWILARIARHLAHRHDGVSVFTSPRSLHVIFATIIFAATVAFGYFDDAQSLLSSRKDQETVETFAMSRYLASHSDPSDMVLKDHNYVTADSWIKLFFLRGYNYPLSRGYFKRYEDETNPREQCTLWMISVPNTDRGRKCYDDTGTGFVVVNPAYDSAQFRKSPDFSLVYVSDALAIYHRNISGK